MEQAPPLSETSIDALLKVAKLSTSGSLQDKLARIAGRLTASGAGSSAVEQLELKLGDDFEVGNC
jgi:hypothetical protein